MKIGLYFCNCGTNVSDKIDTGEVRRQLEKSGMSYFQDVPFGCSEDGQAFLEKHLKEHRPDRVVIAACSPRDHEETFRRVMDRAGLNPYLMQMVNVREHIGWVTADKTQATRKAVSQLKGALARVRKHEPLEKQFLDVRTEALVIGAGPAGLRAALELAEAGRKVTLVEKMPVLGGMPVLYEEVFPKMECGPCLLEPVLGEVLHGPHASRIEVLLLSEVVRTAGSYGNFIVTIRKAPRYVSPQTCIGCAECIPVCPVSAKNPVNNGLNEKKAIDFFFFGGLPNAPFIDPKTCLRFKGESCDKCLKACPMEGAVVYGDREEILERNVGAIIVAIGSELYDCSRLPELGYGRFPDVYTSLEFERLLASNGPTTGALVTRAGAAPKSVAIVHCAGSLDEHHNKYCSAVCCMSAFKFNHLIGKKAPETGITHFFKTMVAAGKEEAEVYHHALHNPKSRFVQYRALEELKVSRKPDGANEIVCSAGGREERGDYDMVVLCPAMVPRAAAAALGKVLEIGSDKTGFFEELNGRIDATKSRVKGIYLAGTCQAPMDIQKAVSQGAAASGSVLSSLVEGRKLEIEPVTAEVDEDRCSACKSCISVCPYKAISFDAEKETAHVNPVLCVGCGTCVAACPSGAIKGKHFTQDQIFAEIEGVLA